MKKGRLFEKLTNKVKPFYEIEDLIQVYHPSVLSKETSFLIFESQQQVDLINDEINQLNTELEKIREEKITKENKARRFEIGREILALREEADNEIFVYIAALAKMDVDAVKALFTEKLSQYSLDLELSQFAQEAFSDIAEALMDYKEEELSAIPETTPTPKTPEGKGGIKIRTK